jgi:uncharacterized protein YjbI with pentapeptide repeats
MGWAASPCAEGSVAEKAKRAALHTTCIPFEYPSPHRDAPMANDEHVALLKQGVAAWNSWRNENANIRPDLGGADLRGANLVGANLNGADLRGAVLSDADLREANLRGANFDQANLIRADLIGSDLGEANLSGANLSGAKLDRAFLMYVSLIGANLRGAHLTEADLSQANLSGANLREANFSQATGRDVNLRRANLGEATASGALLFGDLRGANLRHANLSKASLGGNLKGADLFETNLSGADLRGANLRGAKYLSEANLSGANLRYADLSETDLSRANLNGADLREADLGGADLCEANLSGADLRGAQYVSEPKYMTEVYVGPRYANLSKANLSGADLRGAKCLNEARYLSEANLSGANLNGADLSKANLGGADLSKANLGGANLQAATLVDTDLTDAHLTGCRVHGVSAWRLKLDGTKQQNLVITPPLEPAITVDDIEVAQFIYLMLDNQKVRAVIDTITSKAVLILGRFTDERKAVLDALREELRKHNYLPILFDFNVPATRDITETVSLLARMARFIVADLTDPSSIPKELEAIVSQLAVPVQPLLEGASRPYAMFKDYWKYDWVLPVYRYERLEPLLATLAEKVIDPAEGKVRTLQERRRMIEAELTKPQ